MVGALVDALAQAQFRMAYQPIFTMDGEIVAFEALLRWKHPTWGQISPLEFIPTAEKSGLIVAIGDWVIDEVCRQAMEWNAADVHPVKIFANVSGVQLARPDFGSKIADALARSGLAPDRLELEITESWVISDLRGAAGKLQKLRDLGIGIAIDDFGTGYATFNYLQELPLDTLKIDRSFIQRLDGSCCQSCHRACHHHVGTTAGAENGCRRRGVGTATTAAARDRMRTHARIFSRPAAQAGGRLFAAQETTTLLTLPGVAKKGRLSATECLTG